VEPLPIVRPDGGTNVAGLWIAGDLAGIPLLKFAIDSGARAVRAIARALPPDRDRAIPDVAILGAGPAGLNAALEARALGLSALVLDAAEPMATIATFPVAKPIYAYPRAWKPAGRLEVSARVKEPLLDELRAQAAGVDVRRAHALGVTRARGRMEVELEGEPPLHAHHVLVAIGRAGDHRRLGVPGEARGQVSDRLHDPTAFAGRPVVVVGGGDTATECAVALAEAGAAVTLVHRGSELVRPRPETVARVRALMGEGRGRIRARFRARVREIGERDVVVGDESGREERLPATAVFVLIGREAPLAFFRRSGVTIAGERGPRQWWAFAAFLAFCVWLHDWKSGGAFAALWSRLGWFPTDVPQRLAALGGAVAAQAADPRTALGTLAVSAASPAFWVTLVYSLVILGFGVRRIRRRATPYITAQTWTLVAIQVVPLFLLPEIVLPLAGANGWIPASVADALFPAVDYGHGREYWRAYGFVLAWPLNVYNIFTHEPLWAWIAIGAVQLGILLPLGVWAFGKGFYCGWICSCGALAETLGDDQREKMPHGPGWNRLNLAGQVILALAFVLLLVRIVGWAVPGDDPFQALLEGPLLFGWKWGVDVALAGVLGLGAYFWFSGRTWCRFFCPLAALLHVYARFSRFAIVPDKARCISCNQCTSVCHMGIDVMTPAQRGEPMRDPQCVRCSACVHACPTGVLQFGQVDGSGFVSLDSLAASPVLMREKD
jgi:thioredoxin reductase/polyferredoxin